MNYKKKYKLSLSRKDQFFTKTLTNAAWLIGDKVFTMVIGIFVIALIARYLGPESYGVYNYALAFVTLFTAFSTLGLDTLSIKSIVNNEEEEGTILYTSLVLRFFGGLFLTIASYSLIKIVAPNDPVVHFLVIIFSLVMVFRSLEVIEYWIQAHQKSKISSLIRMSVYVFSSFLKILFVYFEGELIHLAFIQIIDVLIIGIALIIAYFKKRTLHTKWKFKISYAKYILSQSWYLIFSGLMVTLYMQMDKVMLGTILSGKEELGIYSAATQISNIWYFVPLALITSFKPVIMKKKLESEEKYLNSLQTLYSLVTWIGIIFGLLITLFANILVIILYGSEYSAATNIIIISVWAGIFATLGSARSIWLLTENLQKYTLVYTSVGFAVNLLLNYILIPIYGGSGAAMATLISQIVANVFALAFFKNTKISTVMILRSFSPTHLLKIKKNFF